MRKTYKFSSCITNGGFLYAHKTADNQIIENKNGLKNALNKIAKEFELIDVTIKIYGSIFFFFFMMRPVIKTADIITSIHENISPFGLWNNEYIYSSVYDLQEEYVRKDLKKLGFDYNKGI